MKRITTTTLLVAGIALGAPAFLAAQASSTTTPPTAETGRDMNKDKKNKDKADKDRYHGTSANTADFQRVSKDAIDNQVTAKDVIGQAVYGSDGEKLGDISDLTVSSEFQAARMAQAATRADRDTLGADRTPGTGTGATADTGIGAAEREAGDAWSAAKSMVGMEEPHAIISVGGVLGVGDDLVAVPLSALEYDSAEERYTLNVQKSEFVSIAERDAGTDDLE